jgi:hypothetical protein
VYAGLPLNARPGLAALFHPPAVVKAFGQDKAAVQDARHILTDGPDTFSLLKAVSDEGLRSFKPFGPVKGLMLRLAWLGEPLILLLMAGKGFAKKSFALVSGEIKASGPLHPPAGGRSLRSEGPCASRAGTSPGRRAGRAGPGRAAAPSP